MEHLLIGATFFLLGYTIAKMDAIIAILKRSEAHSSFVKTAAREAKTRRRVEIDDNTYVTDVSTSGMEAAGDTTLGVVSQSKDDITTATNKLAQLKKLKG